MSNHQQTVSGYLYPRRVGLLGGTFDPPHIGHLVAALQVKQTLGLEEVRLVVANEPWQKTGTRKISNSNDRLQMVQAATTDHPGLGIVTSDVEMRIGGPSYMVNTLKLLAQQEPEIDFAVIVGADTASQLDTWHDAEELKKSADFVVVNRPGYVANPAPGWNCELVEIPDLDLSSSALRAMVADEKPITFLTTPAVIQHIEAQGLYRQEL